MTCYLFNWRVYQYKIMLPEYNWSRDRWRHVPFFWRLKDTAPLNLWSQSFYSSETQCDRGQLKQFRVVMRRSVSIDCNRCRIESQTRLIRLPWCKLFSRSVECIKCFTHACFSWFYSQSSYTTSMKNPSIRTNGLSMKIYRIVFFKKTLENGWLPVQGQLSFHSSRYIFNH